MKRLLSVFIICFVMLLCGCTKKTANTSVDTRVPVEAKWQTGDMTYDNNDTIYYKNYYDDFVRGRIMDIRFPEINLQENLEDYFQINDNIVEGMYILTDMFFDNRTIEMNEEELKALFYSQGYYLYLHNAQIDDLHIRLVEIQEIDGLSLYPSRTLIQTWDDENIYLEDITGPIPRKIRSFLIIDDNEETKMIIHSSGFSVDYVSEEELSFWSFRGSYWVLTPIELDIDTSHAHNAGNLYPDLDRDELFPAVYYRDGIAYRSSMQGDGVVSNDTYRLGKLEEVEKNRSFRLVAVYENMGKTFEKSDCYIQFNIEQGHEGLNTSANANVMDIYESFLNGELTVELKEQQVHINELFWNNDIEYCFFDIDGDGNEELHVRDDVIYYVVKAEDGVPRIMFEGWWCYEPIVTNELCGIVRYMSGYRSEDIEFFRLSVDGSMEGDGWFHWFDENNNGNIDEEDHFLGPGDIDMEQYVQYVEKITIEQQENELEWTDRKLKNFATWQEAYIDFINKIHVTTYDIEFEYSLIYVDADDIPELYIDTGVSLGEIIVSFYNGKIGTMNRDRGGIAYIEHGGLLYSWNGAMGSYPFNVYMLEKGVFSEIGTGVCYEHIDGQGDILYYDYFWENKAVTEAEFNAYIAELIDTSECISPSLLYSEDEIWEMLHN